MDSNSQISISKIAQLLGTSEETLILLAEKAPRLYRRWSEKKRNGGERIIEAPTSELKTVQKSLAVKILNSLPVHPSLHGAPGTSQITAARFHVNQPVVMTMDIKNFFPSVSLIKVKETLLQHGFGEEATALIGRLCTTKRRLPQGAPTSPVLARLVIREPLDRICSAVRNAGTAVQITQYVDDLTISGPNGIQRFDNLVKKIFSQYGFVIHPEKTKIMKGAEEKEVLGMKVNTKLEITSKYMAELDHAKKTMARSDSRLVGKKEWKRKVDRSN